MCNEAIHITTALQVQDLQFRGHYGWVILDWFIILSNILFLFANVYLPNNNFYEWLLFMNARIYFQNCNLWANLFNEFGVHREQSTLRWIEHIGWCGTPFLYTNSEFIYRWCDKVVISSIDGKVKQIFFLFRVNST